MLREFKDKDGTEWRVWDVDPDAAQAQLTTERRKSQSIQGWLCFESPIERRRLSPIPRNWDSTNPEKLAELCEKAQVVRPRPQNIEPPARKPIS